MRVAVESSRGPATVEFIYTSAALIQKATETIHAVDAMSSHARQNGDGQGLILCTAVEQTVRGLLRKEYAIQEDLRQAADAEKNADERGAGLEQSVDALTRHVKAQQEVIDNYKRSLAFYEQADKSPNKSQEIAKEPTKEEAKQPSRKDNNLILAQEKEILALQRQVVIKNQVLMETHKTGGHPERLTHLQFRIGVFFCQFFFP